MRRLKFPQQTQAQLTHALVMFDTCEPGPAGGGLWCHGKHIRLSSETVVTVLDASGSRRCVRAAQDGAQWFGWIDLDGLQAVQPKELQLC